MDSTLKGMLNLLNLFKFPQKLLNLWTGLSSSSSITSIYYKIFFFFITFSWVVTSSLVVPFQKGERLSLPHLSLLGLWNARVEVCLQSLLLLAGPVLSDNPSISFPALTAQCFTCKHLSVTDCQTLELKSDTCFFGKGGVWNMNAMLRLRVSLLFHHSAVLESWVCVPATERKPFLLAICELSQWIWRKYQHSQSKNYPLTACCSSLLTFSLIPQSLAFSFTSYT